MQIKSAIFKMSARDHSSAPDWDFNEFAFIGRSNVGKSSMINMLTNKEGLAKISATPGKTQLLNFFVINDKWSLVDLPGYGYAKIAKSEKINFNESVGDYIEKRGNLRHVFVLIDSRIPPQAIDLDFIHWLCGCEVPFSFVFTKADKQSLKKSQASISEFLSATSGFLQHEPQVILSSSKTRDGRNVILNTIQATLAS